MDASGSNRFGLTCASVRRFMLEQNRQVRMGDLVGSSSFQRPLHTTPVPVPAATGPAGAWDTGATTLSLFTGGTGATTLSLFPGGTGKEIIRPEEANATLTIFYQGQVATFHNFPAERARDLMEMAGSVIGNGPEEGVTTAVPEKAEACDEPSAGMPPIARRLTLQRFLSKRKNRITGTDDPDYNEDIDALQPKKRDFAGAGGNPAEDVPDDDALWLRL